MTTTSTHTLRDSIPLQSVVIVITDYLNFLIRIHAFADKDFYKLRQNTIQMGNSIMSKFQSIETTLPHPDDYSTLARMKRSLYYGFFQHYAIVWRQNDEFFHEYEQKLKKNLQMQSKICKWQQFYLSKFRFFVIF